MFERARGRAVDLGYAAGWGAIKSVPRPLSERWFQAGADAATVRNGPGAQQLRKNLRRVLGPDVSELLMDAYVGDALRSYSRYWLETFRLPKMDLREVAAKAGTTTVGTEHLDAALERGRGTVLALPHSGNWDVAGVWLVQRHGPFTTVAERLKPESLFRRFVEYRESLGFEIIALTGGERPPLDVLADRLRANKVVCLLADRDLSRHGVEVDFFGEPTRMPPGPALLAARTGAALLPVHVWYTRDGWGQTIAPPLDLPDTGLGEQVRLATQQLADFFAREIKAHPVDWHMLQKLWLADLSPRAAARVAAARPRA
ncbi:MAG: phosphatidylinositol mannoside acyltransferase [Jatrophihabitans sp.]|uniref:phosphatidylinositol mannoside acyltransferase n=1 Tax=Jatrophihabitans sp. TaxID=1932789 RepID=UPI003F7F4B92